MNRLTISLAVLLMLLFSYAHADQVVIQQRSPIYQYAGGELIGHVEAGVRVDSITSKKGYTQASLVGWIPTVSVRGEGPRKTVSITANGAIVYDSANGISIGDILPYERAEMDSVAGEWVHVRVEGWIPTENMVVEAPLKRVETKPTSNTFLAAGFCLLATAALSFNGMSYVNLDVKGMDEAIEELERQHISVPGSLRDRRENYAAVRTRYAILGVTTAIAGVVCIVQGVTISKRSKSGTPLSMVSPMAGFGVLPTVGVQLRF